VALRGSILGNEIGALDSVSHVRTVTRGRRCRVPRIPIVDGARHRAPNSSLAGGDMRYGRNRSLAAKKRMSSAIVSATVQFELKPTRFSEDVKRG